MEYVGRKKGLLCPATLFLNLDDFKALPALRAKDITNVEMVSHCKNVH